MKSERQKNFRKSVELMSLDFQPSSGLQLKGSLLFSLMNKEGIINRHFSILRA